MTAKTHHNPVAMNQDYIHLLSALAQRYSEGEARAIAFLLFEEAFGVSRTDIYADKVRQFSEDEAQRLHLMCNELLQGIPVQYVLGHALFCGHSFNVTPDVLIPRPETEELVAWTAETVSLLHVNSERPLHVLDAGTGSGCIAISLQLLLGGQAAVEACDISSRALKVAQLNAQQLSANVHFFEYDLLQEPQPSAMPYDIIVSNPPYICQSEQTDMEEHVLQHEPHTALFVPDADPQLFYRALAHLALTWLAPGGALLVEGNRAYVDETAAMFTHLGLERADVRCDAFGNKRMVRAFRPTSTTLQH